MFQYQSWTQLLGMRYRAYYQGCYASYQVRRREVIGNTAALDTSSTPYPKIWVGKEEGTTNISWHHLHVVHISPLLSFDTFRDNIYWRVVFEIIYVWLWWIIVFPWSFSQDLMINSHVQLIISKTYWVRALR